MLKVAKKEQPMKNIQMFFMVFVELRVFRNGLHSIYSFKYIGESRFHVTVFVYK